MFRIMMKHAGLIILRKLSSRKFLTAIVVMIAGLISLFGGPALDVEPIVQAVATIVGGVTALLAALGYIAVEGAVDRERERRRGP